MTSNRQPVSMRVLMLAGGTGGHIFPALAVAQELMARGEVRERGGDSFGPVSIEFLGTKRGLESRVIPAAGFALRTVAAAGLKGLGAWGTLRNLTVLPRSALESATVLRDLDPHVVVGIGGYLAGPAMLEAALREIPTLLMEPNATPGFTNRVLAPVVRAAAVAFAEAARYYGAKARVTGHAVRKEFSRIPAKEHAAPFTILVLGGSQGASAINETVTKTLPFLAPALAGRRYSQGIGLQLIHQTGERDLDAVRKAYQQHGVTAEVHAFIDDVPQAFARADLIISRSGATAVAELAAAGKASLLIPFPAATDHHQRENARAMGRVGGARVIEQTVLTPERLAREVSDLLSEPVRLREMERCARTLASPHAAERIADWIEELVRRQ